MYNQNFNPFINSMPTSTQPYGYVMNNLPNYMQQTQNQTQQNQSTTNIIFVSGLEDVKTRWQAPSTEMFYADNDKPLLYKKQVYANGQFDVKTYDISEHLPDKDAGKNDSIDLSGYVKTSDFEKIKEEIKSINEKLNSKKMEVQNAIKPNGNNGNGRIEPANKQI